MQCEKIQWRLRQPLLLMWCKSEFVSFVRQGNRPVKTFLSWAQDDAIDAVTAIAIQLANTQKVLCQRNGQPKWIHTPDISGREWTKDRAEKSESQTKNIILQFCWPRIKSHTECEWESPRKRWAQHYRRVMMKWDTK